MSETKDQTASREMLECGHPVSLLIKSVESDYQYCELCNAKDERRDALTMEARYKSQLGEMRAELAASRADAYERAEGVIRNRICCAYDTVAMHDSCQMLYQILSDFEETLFTPTDAAARAELDRRIRLEEAELWLNEHYTESEDAIGWGYKRVAELRAPVPAERAGDACNDCDEAARLANSDATTPGFFSNKCAKHRAGDATHVHTSACYGKVPETEGAGSYLRCGFVTGDAVCQKCHGYTWIETMENGTKTCPDCHGTGRASK